jgi:chlorite dismutase
MAETRTQEQKTSEERLPAQYINYLFFKLDPEWRRLSDEERERGKEEFLRAAEEHEGSILLRSFFLMGLRSDVDFML